MAGNTNKSTNEFRIFGSPGTGKTWTMTAQIQAETGESGEESIVVCSLTNAAAEVIGGRNTTLPSENVGTVHAICFRLLDRPVVADDPKVLVRWNTEFPYYRITPKGGRAGADDGGRTKHAAATRGDEYYQAYQVYRAQMTPRSIWRPHIQAFASEWEDWKRREEAVDFCDMISRCLEEQIPLPSEIRVGFLDEAQDCDRLTLTLFRQWGQSLDRIVLAGDDDQCQPPGSIICTTTGHVPIAALRPDQHRLLSYDPHDKKLYGFRNGGYGFRVAENHYDGPMLSVRAGSRTTQCTPNHKWLVRWTDEAKTDAHVVYLMRKGVNWRVGWCKLTRGDGCFHLGVRARNEGADAAWVLKTTSSRAEASLWESYVAARYGLPLVMFHAASVNNLYTQENLDWLFAQLHDTIDLLSRAQECLRDYGRDLQFPLWTPEEAYAKRGGTTLFLTRACNLLPGLMALPITEEGACVTWAPLQSLMSTPYQGPVYSLDVEKYHMYVADGLVTHNCIFSFRGSDPAALLEVEIPDDHTHVRPQSYRLPRTVYALAQAWIERLPTRQPKIYLPRDAEGVVDMSSATVTTPEPLLDRIEESLGNGKTVMILTSCAYMLGNTKKMLRKFGIPFHNPMRPERTDWNPLTPHRGVSSKERLLAFLGPDPTFQKDSSRMIWTANEIRLWTEVMRTDRVLHHKMRSVLEALEGDHEITLSQLQEWLLPEAVAPALSLDLDWFGSALIDSKRDPFLYPLTVAERHGPEALVRPPRLIVGTIHSTKGGEADHVMLFPDLPPSSSYEWERGNCDSIIRQFYVGMTRAYETLTVCSPASSSFVRGLL